MSTKSDQAYCDGEIVSVYPEARGAWTVHGVRFVGRDAQRVDLLNDVVFEVVVLQLPAHLSQPSAARQLYRNVKRRLLKRLFPRQVRHYIAFPVRMTTPLGEFVVATWDVSTSGVGLMCPRPIPLGSSVRLTIYDADDEAEIDGIVVRCEPFDSASPNFRTWSLGIRLNEEGDAMLARTVLSWRAA